MPDIAMCDDDKFPIVTLISEPNEDFQIIGKRLDGTREEVDFDTKEVLFVPCPDGLIAAIVGVWPDDGRFYSWVWYSDPFNP